MAMGTKENKLTIQSSLVKGIKSLPKRRVPIPIKSVFRIPMASTTEPTKIEALVINTDHVPIYVPAEISPNPQSDDKYSTKAILEAP